MAQSHSLAYMPGMELLQEPRLNKSTAFAEAEREALGLTGLLPDVVESEDVQLKRVLPQLAHKTSDLDRYIYLVGLLDHNETLFYRTADVRSRPASCRSSTIRPSARPARSSATSSGGRAACTSRSSTRAG